MLLPWLIFSPPCNCAGGKHICSCQSVSLPPLCLSVCLAHSCAVSLLLSLCPHNSSPAFFFSSHLVSALPTSAGSEAPESFCVFGVLFWSCLVPAASVTQSTLWQVTQSLTGTLHFHVTYMAVSLISDFETDLNMLLTTAVEVLKSTCWLNVLHTLRWMLLSRVLYSFMRTYTTCLWLVVPLGIQEVNLSALEPHSSYWAFTHP